MDRITSTIQSNILAKIRSIIIAEEDLRAFRTSDTRMIRIISMRISATTMAKLTVTLSS